MNPAGTLMQRALAAALRAPATTHLPLFREDHSTERQPRQYLSSSSRQHYPQPDGDNAAALKFAATAASATAYVHPSFPFASSKHEEFVFIVSAATRASVAVVATISAATATATAGVPVGQRCSFHSRLSSRRLSPSNFQAASQSNNTLQPQQRASSRHSHRSSCLN
jgi:hypothetical protein